MLSSAFFAGLVAVSPSFAQDDSEELIERYRGPTLSTEGIQGSTDKKDRDPTLSVTEVPIPASEEGGARVKLLAYAEVASHEFKEFPIRFEFYVNQRLISTQVRSSDLDGPVGVDVTPDIATQPFNYSVVATVLHPNRQFTTMLTGASFASDLVASLDCTATLAFGDDEVGSLFQVNGTQSAQRGNDTIELSFTALRDDEEEEAEVSTTITLTRVPSSTESDTIDATGSLTASVDGESKSESLTGSVTFTEGELDAITLESESGETSLDCSAATGVEASA
jgi:hypothetical protein